MNKRMLMISIGLLALAVAAIAFAQSRSAGASTAFPGGSAAVVLAQDDDSAEDEDATTDDGTEADAATDDSADADAATTGADGDADATFTPPVKAFANVDLNAGFLLDPYLLRVLGGGLQPAADLDAACSGYVPASPNATLNWTGTSEALSVYVYSDADPVLVIETPDGEFLCNDDAGALVLDPLVTIEAPTEGTYNIYVGSADLGDFYAGFLVMTELTADLGSLDLMPLLDRRDAPIIDTEAVAAALQFDIEPIFGTVAISPGFDPVEAIVAGGGAIPIHNLSFVDETCAGFASIVPSYAFTWSGNGSGLTVFLEAQADAALVIRTPNGEIVCSDNVSADNFNPSVDIPNPAEGEYDIYIAAPTFNDVIPGVLTITAEPNAAPSAPASDSD
ncbi:MAG: hypothetical protein M9918_17655 [Anaerolineae bacterium]|nr:hypothetical protein [Anaerolineae bacterium]